MENNQIKIVAGATRVDRAKEDTNCITLTIRLAIDGAQVTQREKKRRSKTSEFYGVSKRKGNSNWTAMVRERESGKIASIGTYEDEEACAEAVDNWLINNGEDPRNALKIARRKAEREIKARTPIIGA